MAEQQKHILLILGGGIAAYKALELIRRLRDRGFGVRCVLTKAATEFVTPLSVAALSENPVYTDLFSLKDEVEMGHIQLSRQADLLVVCPATADLMAKMAAGLATDLATTVLLATDKSVLIVPAMNVRMWTHPATQANLATLLSRGIQVLGPVEGAMACGEFGAGRMVEPADIAEYISTVLSYPQRLKDVHIIVSAGPTHEPIDPVRYIANRSSGKQGFALAQALAQLGARVTLVAGPVSLPTPAGVMRVDVETAREMLQAVEAALPAQVYIGVAAVADWGVEPHLVKIKKTNAGPPTLTLQENPDILARIAQLPKTQRPHLVVGFAAETHDVLAHAQDKCVRKGCDWIVANDVAQAGDERLPGGAMGGDNNLVHLITRQNIESWPLLLKTDVAMQLAERIADELGR
jgi:phosphopantothenoylcysteine decarboxylase / phosphopantothenate---cysteine ligase